MKTHINFLNVHCHAAVWARADIDMSTSAWALMACLGPPDQESRVAPLDDTQGGGDEAGKLGELASCRFNFELPDVNSK